MCSWNKVKLLCRVKQGKFFVFGKEKGLIKWTFSTAQDNGKKLGEEINIMA